MRLNVEVTQLRRDRRGSPVLKDEPVSPKSQFDAERRLSSSILMSRRSTKEQPNVQNLIQNFNKDSDDTDDRRDEQQQVVTCTSPPNVPCAPSSSVPLAALRRNLSERRDTQQMKIDAQKSREYLSERVSQLRAKAEKNSTRATGQDAPLMRRSATSRTDEPISGQNDPLQALSKKYGCGSKRNALLKVILRLDNSRVNIFYKVGSRRDFVLQRDRSDQL